MGKHEGANMKAFANSLRLVYQSDVREDPSMNYEKLGHGELKKILRSNPPDVPHYGRALEERKRRYQSWMLIVTCAGVVVEILRMILSTWGRR
jgi:hypothetical protein